MIDSTMTPATPRLTLNNGVELPALGLGVFQTPAGETRDAVRAALDAGHRHIDTAAAYGNEQQVRSSATPTSNRETYRSSGSSTGSSRRRGLRLVGSRSTATAATAARSMTRSSERSRPGTGRHRRR